MDGPKVHLIFCEIPYFISEVNEPLGKFSAHPFETVHTDFLPTYARYKRKESHPEHGSQLKRATVDYDSHHI